MSSARERPPIGSLSRPTPPNTDPTALRLVLGGVGIELISRAASLTLSANLRTFIAPDTAPPDMRLRVARKRIPPVAALGECFYDSRGIFAFYRQNTTGVETLAFFNAFIHPPDQPYQIVQFAPDYRSAALTYSAAAYRIARSRGDRSREALAAFETPLDEIVCISLLGRGRGLLLHASAAVTPEGQGVVFVGPSGAGKSTLARLCDRAGWRVLSDERVIARPGAGGWTIYGTPWVSSARLFAADSAPLAALFVLRHAPHNSATPLRGMAAIAPLLSQSCPPLWSVPGVETTLDFIERLATDVPCYDLGFLPDASALGAVRAVL